MDPVTITFQNPLNETHLQQINSALDAVKFAKDQISMAKRAGIDVTAQEAAALDAEKKLITIKQVYFPNR